MVVIYNKHPKTYVGRGINKPTIPRKVNCVRTSKVLTLLNHNFLRSIGLKPEL
jgi:hypothetical protein